MKFIYDVTGEKLINCDEISIIEIKESIYAEDGNIDSCSVCAKLKYGHEYELKYFYQSEGVGADDKAVEWIEEMRMYLTDNEPWIFG